MGGGGSWKRRIKGVWRRNRKKIAWQVGEEVYHTDPFQYGRDTPASPLL